MRVLVCVKRVVDYAVKVRVNAGKTAVETNGVKMAMNPFDEIATEEAVKMKDSGIATEVIAVTVGPKTAQDQLRTALAMGADKGVHVETDLRTDQDLQPLAVSKVLSWVAKKYNADAVIVGKQAIDDDYNQTGQMIAQKLNWPQATFASKITVDKEKKVAQVSREIDSGIENITVQLPAVFTTDLRLNTPRYATLPNIMKAKKKPIDSVKIDETGVDVKPRLKTVAVNEPPTRKAGVKVDTVEALVDALVNNAKVISK